MSLNQFLAVGRSFVGIREEKSPFEMKKDCLLPRFEAAPRFAPKGEPRMEALLPRLRSAPVRKVEVPVEIKAAVQTDWLVEKKAAPAPEVAEITTAPRTKMEQPARSWVSLLTFGLLGKRGKKGAALVQGELCLEKVRVIRNDLHDSDLELVRREERPRARKATAAARSWSTAEEEQPWTKLATRLFEIERR